MHVEPIINDGHLDPAPIHALAPQARHIQLVLGHFRVDKVPLLGKHGVAERELRLRVFELARVGARVGARDGLVQGRVHARIECPLGALPGREMRQAAQVRAWDADRIPARRPRCPLLGPNVLPPAQHPLQRIVSSLRTRRRRRAPTVHRVPACLASPDQPMPLELPNLLDELNPQRSGRLCERSKGNVRGGLERKVVVCHVVAPSGWRGRGCACGRYRGAECEAGQEDDDPLPCAGPVAPRHVCVVLLKETVSLWLLDKLLQVGCGQQRGVDAQQPPETIRDQPVRCRHCCVCSLLPTDQRRSRPTCRDCGTVVLARDGPTKADAGGDGGKGADRPVAGRAVVVGTGGGRRLHDPRIT